MSYLPDLISRALGGGNGAANDFLTEAARGRVAGVRVVDVHGRASFVTGTFQELWEAGGTYTWPTGSAKVHLSSSDASDASAGAGARSVDVMGIGSDLGYYSEVVSLNGTSVVQTTGTFYRVNQVHVSGVGGHGANRGAIAGKHNNVDQMFLIASGTGCSTLGVYTVPSASYGVVREVYANVAFDATTRIRFMRREGGVGSSWRAIRDLEVRGYSDHEPVGPIMLPPMTDLMISTQVTRAGNVSGGPVTAGVLMLVFGPSADDLEPR